jgi:hypothetical protein
VYIGIDCPPTAKLSIRNVPVTAAAAAATAVAFIRKTTTDAPTIDAVALCTNGAPKLPLVGALLERVSGAKAAASTFASNTIAAGPVPERRKLKLTLLTSIV